MQKQSLPVKSPTLYPIKKRRNYKTVETEYECICCFKDISLHIFKSNSGLCNECLEKDTAEYNDLDNENQFN